jgi:hypothetical protein
MESRSYEQLVPITASPAERQAAVDDLADLYMTLRDQGVDPVSGVEPEPDGDRWTISWFEDDAGSLAA